MQAAGFFDHDRQLVHSESETKGFARIFFALPLQDFCRR